MFFKYLTPSPRLQHIVKSYCLLHFEFDKNQPIPVKPFPVRPEHSLVFYLKGSVNSFDPKTGLFKTFPKIAINGTQTKRFDFHISHTQLMFSIDFQQGGLAKFLKTPLNEAFLNERIDAETLLNPDINQVYEQMVNAASYSQIVEIIEKFLWEKTKQQIDDIQPFDRVNLFVLNQPTICSVEYLANQSCLSLSQFERRFKQQIGVSPKFFLRICRFHQAFTLKDQNPTLDWLSIALQTGYTDYQHLVKDFKQFAGTTPNSLLKAQASAPERILRLG